MPNSSTLEEIQEIPGDTPEEKLAFLNNCNCCERHKLNRPNTYTRWYETEFHNTQNTACVCDCRHMARWICRYCTDDSSETKATEEEIWSCQTTTGATEFVL